MSAASAAKGSTTNGGPSEPNDQNDPSLLLRLLPEEKSFWMQRHWALPGDTAQFFSHPRLEPRCGGAGPSAAAVTFESRLAATRELCKQFDEQTRHLHSFTVYKGQGAIEFRDTKGGIGVFATRDIKAGEGLLVVPCKHAICRQVMASCSVPTSKGQGSGGATAGGRTPLRKLFPKISALCRKLSRFDEDAELLRGQQTVVVRSALWNVWSLVRLLFFYELLRSKS